MQDFDIKGSCSCTFCMVSNENNIKKNLTLSDVLDFLLLDNFLNYFLPQLEFIPLTEYLPP